MALEQVDCFNYAMARNDPWGLQELLLVNQDCPGMNLRTYRLFQKHPSLEHTRFLLVLQQSAAGARSYRTLLKSTETFFQMCHC